MRKKLLPLLILLAPLSCKGGGGAFYSDNTRPDVPDYSGGGGGGGDDSGAADDTGLSTDDSADSGDSSADDTGDSSIPGGDDCGSGLHDIVCNIVTTDQAGASWALWDLYGTPTVLVLGNAYDQQLQNISGYLARVASDNDAASAVVLFAGPDQIAADTSDAAAWAATYGLETVLIDPTTAIHAAWSSSFTTTVMLDSDMQVVWISYGYVDEAQMDDRLHGL